MKTKNRNLLSELRGPTTKKKRKKHNQITIRKETETNTGSAVVYIASDLGVKGLKEITTKKKD